MPPKRQISSEAIKMIKYKVLHCTDNINTLPLQRIRNNVEAFRYYLALKSGQFQHFKIIDKWFLRLCFVVYLPLPGRLYTCIKRGIIVLLLKCGQSRASMQ